MFVVNPNHNLGRHQVYLSLSLVREESSLALWSLFTCEEPVPLSASAIPSSSPSLQFPSTSIVEAAVGEAVGVDEGVAEVVAVVVVAVASEDREERCCC